MPPTTECTPGLRVDPGPGGAVTVSVEGILDAPHGRRLYEAVEQTYGCSRVTVDLSRIDRFTTDGIAVAARCWRAGAHLPQGISFVATGGPSRKALLAILDRR